MVKQDRRQDMDFQAEKQLVLDFYAALDRPAGE